MELIRISYDKIKISLSKAELDEYELTVDEMDGGAQKTQRVFRELFVCARDQTGFDTDGERVFVQIFRAKGGGCEIFVSKVSGEKEKKKSRFSDSAYGFSELCELIGACKALDRIGFHSQSSAYKSEDGYLLILSSPSENERAYASEWGKAIDIPKSEYVSEHLSVIRETDAVQTLSSL
ncbi:MAG: adaptor protein MecA [Clostridia bacterium]|nr:adaptor protein MecA [Clostridia bacterium]